MWAGLFGCGAYEEVLYWDVCIVTVWTLNGRLKEEEVRVDSPIWKRVMITSSQCERLVELDHWTRWAFLMIGIWYIGCSLWYFLRSWDDGSSKLLIFGFWVHCLATKSAISCDLLPQWADNQRKVAYICTRTRRMRCASGFVVKRSLIVRRDTIESVMMS